MLNWQNYLAKYFTNLVSVITLAGGLIFGWNYYQDKQYEQQQRQLLEERYKKLENTVQDGAVFDYGTQLITLYKERAEVEKEARIAWKELAKEREERIKLLSTSVVSVDEATESQEGSDYEFKTPGGTKGYSINELRISGKDSPPIGYIMVKQDGKVYKKNYKFEVRVENVQLKDDLTGKIRIVSRAFLVPLENGLAEDRRQDLKKWKDEKFPLTVTGGEVLVDPSEPIVPLIRDKTFITFPMNVNMGYGVFSNNTSTSTKFMGDVTLFGYGYSKRDLDWKFANLGVNYNDQDGVGVHLSPFTYRLFPSILTNSYLGPGYAFDGIGSGYFVGFNLGL